MNGGSNGPYLFLFLSSINALESVEWELIENHKKGFGDKDPHMCWCLWLKLLPRQLQPGSQQLSVKSCGDGVLWIYQNLFHREEDAKTYWCVKMLVKSGSTDRLKLTRKCYGLLFLCHSSLACTFEHMIVCRSNCPMLKLLELPLFNITMLFDVICQRGNLKWLKCMTFMFIPCAPCVPCAPCASFWSLKRGDSNPRVLEWRWGEGRSKTVSPHEGFPWLPMASLLPLELWFVSVICLLHEPSWAPCVWLQVNSAGRQAVVAATAPHLAYGRQNRCTFLESHLLAQRYSKCRIKRESKVHSVVSEVPCGLGQVSIDVY
jgi:hypothetical protein